MSRCRARRRRSPCGRQRRIDGRRRDDHRPARIVARPPSPTRPLRLPALTTSTIATSQWLPSRPANRARPPAQRRLRASDRDPAPRADAGRKRRDGRPKPIATGRPLRKTCRSCRLPLALGGRPAAATEARARSRRLSSRAPPAPCGGWLLPRARRACARCVDVALCSSRTVPPEPDSGFVAPRHLHGVAKVLPRKTSSSANWDAGGLRSRGRGQSIDAVAPASPRRRSPEPAAQRRLCALWRLRRHRGDLAFDRPPKLGHVHDRRIESSTFDRNQWSLLRRSARRRRIPGRDTSKPRAQLMHVLARRCATRRACGIVVDWQRSPVFNSVVRAGLRSTKPAVRQARGHQIDELARGSKNIWLYDL